MRTPGSRALRLALVQLAVGACVIAGVEIALLVAQATEPPALFVGFVLVALGYVVVGVLTWRRRPSNATGALLCLCGFSLLAAAAGNTGVPVLVALGYITAELPIGVLLHLLLAFPSGRLPDRWTRGLAVAGYGVTVGLQAPAYLFGSDPLLPAAVRIADRPDLVALGATVKSTAGIVVVVLAALVLARRVRRADRAQRRVLAAVCSYGGFVILFLAGSANLARVLDVDPRTRFLAQLVVVAGVPVAFVVSVLRGRFARAGQIEELGAWLGAPDGARPGLRDALASTLGDPSLELLFWHAESAHFVDASGQPVVAPPSTQTRGQVEVTFGGRPVGAIVYDRVLLDHPQPVRDAGRVVALAVERERLTAALLASQRALRESRTRLVESADGERRRIARDLHDGLQARLVVLALLAGRLAARSGPRQDEALRLRAGLEDAIAQLRSLVHGVMPALLLQRGLVAAIEELLDQTPIRSRLEGPDLGPLDVAVETAGYFLVAEALANAVKHSGARELHVQLIREDDHLVIEVRDDGVGGATIESEAGLRGIADRVDALGGRLSLVSPDGAGTRLRAELPCGS